ncbi:hypothetical protein VTH06DRAFT_6403 [Thermothelomyces fergusii]
MCRPHPNLEPPP